MTAETRAPCPKCNGTGWNCDIRNYTGTVTAEHNGCHLAFKRGDSCIEATIGQDTCRIPIELVQLMVRMAGGYSPTGTEG